MFRAICQCALCLQRREQASTNYPPAFAYMLHLAKTLSEEEYNKVASTGLSYNPYYMNGAQGE